ncbi:MAG: cysteine hydrolase [Pseudomonadota bacterium]
MVRIAASEPAWLAALAGRPGRRSLPSLAGAHLLLLDLQHLFVDPASPAFLRGWPAAAGPCAALLAAFRQRGRPVIWTRHINPGEDGAGIIGDFGGRPLRRDDPLSALAMEPAGGERVLEKARYSAWSGTDLAALLPPGAPLVIAGVTTHRCVLAAGVEAASRDVRAVVVGDATATRDADLQHAALACLASGFTWVASAEEVIHAL